MLDLAECFRQYGLFRIEAQGALKDIRVRPRLGDCLEAMAIRGVPVAIVSGSARDFIWWVLAKNRLDRLVDEVYALHLLFDSPDGRLIGYQSETLVTPSSKGQRSREFAAKHGVPEERIFGIGDSLVDCNIGGLKEHRLGVAESDRQAELIRPVMGHVVHVDQGFGPVNDWMNSQLDQLLG
jgi:phosphoserine phosphatase